MNQMVKIIKLTMYYHASVCHPEQRSVEILHYAYAAFRMTA